MESPSSRVLYQNEKKLKQATLPFEILKVTSKEEPQISKRQRRETSDDDQEVILITDSDRDCIELVPIGSDENSQSEEPVPKKSKTDLIEPSELPAESSKLILEKKHCESESCKSDSVCDTGLKNDSVEIVEENVKNVKRNLESEDKLKGQKPPKRAKLIYNVDKINKDSGESNKYVNNCAEVQIVNNVNQEIVKSESERSSQTSSINSDSKFTEGSIDESENKSNVNYSQSNQSSGEEQLMEDEESDVKLISEQCVTPKNDKSPGSENKPVKRLTPKQLNRIAEIAKKREEKELLLQEKKRMKKERLEEKERLKQEKEEQKKKLKEEREKKKQAEIELKNEEKRKKEEERRKKEEQKLEDKRRKEEQKLEDKRKKEEEEELMKKKFTKEAEVFSSFFKKCDAKSTNVREDEKSFNEIVFMPFTIKSDMRLAPINRNPMDSDRRTHFEDRYTEQSECKTYLKELSSGVRVPGRSGNTWPLEEKYDDEVILLDDGLDLKDEVKTLEPKRFKDRRPKLLQFYENRRPPYWGTWRKKSKSIRAKNPFGKDEIFDYEVDSDEEWEEEEPGESLHGSDDEKESEDDYEVDNDFFVPHGYLSDDENPEDEFMTPEIQKAKLKILGEQFDLERNEKTKLLKPITLGCIWFNGDSHEPDSVNPSIVKLLNKRKAVVWTDNVPITLIQDENSDPLESNLSDGGLPSNSKKVKFPDAAIPELIGFINGSTNSRKTLAKMFLMHWNGKEDKVGGFEINTGLLTQYSIAKKIKELGKWEECPEEGPNMGKWCWCVRKEIRDRFGVVDSKITNKFDDVSADGKDGDSMKKVSPSLITKFTKVLTDDERRNQLEGKSSSRKFTLLASPNLLSDSSLNTCKVQFKPLKYVKKLQEFWAKPSINAKYPQGVSIPAESSDLGVGLLDDAPLMESIASETKMQDVEELGKVTENSSSTFEDQEIVCLSDYRMDEKEKDEAMDVEMYDCKCIDDVLERNLRDCKQSSVEDVAANPEPSTKASETEPPPAFAEEVPDSPKISEKKEPDMKPAPKKRVPILFSAPRGCEIMKPNSALKKAKASLDKVVKKYESISSSIDKDQGKF